MSFARDDSSTSTARSTYETKVKGILLRSQRFISVSVGAVLIALIGSTLAAAPASASPAIEASVATSSSLNDKIVESAPATDEEWDAEIEQLLASDIPRTVTEDQTRTLYTFHLDVDGEGVPDNYVLDYTLAVADDGIITPMLSGGSNQHGPYIDLNGFDQDLVISGGAAAIGLAACAIPGLGWVSCVAITAGLTVAAVALSNNGKCPGNFRIYLNRPRDEPHYVCV